MRLVYGAPKAIERDSETPGLESSANGKKVSNQADKIQCTCDDALFHGISISIHTREAKSTDPQNTLRDGTTVAHPLLLPMVGEHKSSPHGIAPADEYAMVPGNQHGEKDGSTNNARAFRPTARESNRRTRFLPGER